MSVIDDTLADAVDRLRALDLRDTFDLRAAEAIVGAGLHRLAVPTEMGGLGGHMRDAVRVLAAGRGRWLDCARVRDAGARHRRPGRIDGDR
jgi:hypothetical protein